MQQLCTKYDILEGAKVLTFKKGTDIPFRVTGYSVNHKKQIDVLVSKTSEDIVKRIYDMSTATWFSLFPYENEEIELMDIVDLRRVKTKFLSFEDEVEIKYGNLKYFSIYLYSVSVILICAVFLPFFSSSFSKIFAKVSLPLRALPPIIYIIVLLIKKE